MICEPSSNEEAVFLNWERAGQGADQAMKDAQGDK